MATTNGFRVSWVGLSATVWIFIFVFKTSSIVLVLVNCVSKQRAMLQLQWSKILCFFGRNAIFFILLQNVFLNINLMDIFPDVWHSYYTFHSLLINIHCWYMFKLVTINFLLLCFPFRNKSTLHINEVRGHTWLEYMYAWNEPIWGNSYFKKG